MTEILPEVARMQHIAVLGKTGSGKTSTAKVIVEQEVNRGSRVCVIDPIKSDWWGLTSSADGSAPGLPFYILGGPHGHVPLHESSGKAIGELVATGALPLSILDMAWFQPGGHQEFFVDFAQTLMRRITGVLYLVIEEAHILAPKERAGIGAENMAIHWAKMLATAGRTKGIRLIMATQRTQALHNALLGSCDTMIAHRFTAPADQKPVNDWLKANVGDKALRNQIEGSLSSLQTGQAWLCSGEAKLFELVTFPRIATYDNTATPTDNDRNTHHAVTTAAVDLAGLRALVGDAVKQAEENDPKLLRKRIGELERQLNAKRSPSKSEADASEIAEAEQRGFDRGYQQGKADEWARGSSAIRAEIKLVEQNAHDLARQTKALSMAVDQISREAAEADVTAPAQEKSPPPSAVRRPVARRPSMSSNDDLSPGERSILIAAAQRPDGPTREALAILTGYKRSSRNTYLQRLSAKGFVETGDRIRATAAGIAALGSDFEPLPTGDALRKHWLATLPEGEGRIFAAVLQAWPKSIDRETIREATGYKRSSCNTYLQRLAARELVTSSGDGIRASEVLFG